MAGHAHNGQLIDAPLPGVLGGGAAMREVFRLTRTVAPTRASVMVVGETGTGKELIARAIHLSSGRRDGPYIRVNCGALSESLLESELFGHVKGAFTGAVENRTGRFEAAHTGTLFLDEISSLSQHLQVKLLRVLQEQEFERVGESKSIRVDVRVIAASNRLLEDEVESGRFRDDLYYRLNVVPIHLPPLRQRKEDIPALAELFLGRYAAENDRSVKGITAEGINVLLEHDWPGNVRELENDIERAVVMGGGERITAELLAAQIRGGRRLRLPAKRGEDSAALTRRLVELALAEPATAHAGRLHERLLADVERELIAQTLHVCDQVRIKAAVRLGLNRNTLHKKISELGLLANEPSVAEPPSAK